MHKAGRFNMANTSGNITYYSDWDRLVKAADNTVNHILKKYVAPTAETILKKHIQKDIYDAYTPKPRGWVGRQTYSRRHVLEGAVYSEITTKYSYHEMLITSKATASPAVVKGWSFHNRYPGAFLKLLESGNMGIWYGGFARPAVSNAQSEIDRSDEIVSKIRTGVTDKIGKCFIL